MNCIKDNFKDIKISISLLESAADSKDSLILPLKNMKRQKSMVMNFYYYYMYKMCMINQKKFLKK